MNFKIYHKHLTVYQICRSKSSQKWAHYFCKIWKMHLIFIIYILMNLEKLMLLLVI